MPDEPSCNTRGSEGRTAYPPVGGKPSDFPAKGAEHVVVLHGWNRDHAETQAQRDPAGFAEAHRSEHGPRMSYLHRRAHVHRPDGSLEWGFDE